MRLTQASSAHAPVAPVFSWLVLSKTIVIWPSKIAQLETSLRTESPQYCLNARQTEARSHNLEGSARQDKP
jgi:hypothetical protein